MQTANIFIRFTSVQNYHKKFLINSTLHRHNALSTSTLVIIRQLNEGQGEEERRIKQQRNTKLQLKVSFKFYHFILWHTVVILRKCTSSNINNVLQIKTKKHQLTMTMFYHAYNSTKKCTLALLLVWASWIFLPRYVS